MGYKQQSPLAVDEGGSGQTTYTNGQLLIGNTTGNTLSKSTLTAGTGITVTNGTGTITIDADNNGDVVGPGSATDSNLASFDGVTGKLIKDSGIAQGDVVEASATLQQYRVIVGDSGAKDVAALSSVGTSGQVLTSNGAGSNPSWQDNADGDVTGPASSTNNAIARFDGTTGKIIQNSVVTIADSTGLINSAGTNAGGNTGHRLTNSSNTASSGLNLRLGVGGGSADDPYLRYAVDGVLEYSMGIDNDDSDALVITNANTLNGANYMRMTTDGEVNWPSQPAFLGILSATDSNVTGNNTSFTVGSGNAFTEIFDQGSDFVTTGTFTAPVTGRYFLEFANRLSGTSGATDWIVTIVTSNRSYQQRDVPPTTTSLVADISVIADMDAGDTATFTLKLNGVGADTSDVIGGGTGQTRVSGTLIC